MLHAERLAESVLSMQISHTRVMCLLAVWMVAAGTTHGLQ
jgi:hypothetical protein